MRKEKQFFNVPYFNSAKNRLQVELQHHAENATEWLWVPSEKYSLISIGFFTGWVWDSCG